MSTTKKNTIILEGAAVYAVSLDSSLRRLQTEYDALMAAKRYNEAKGVDKAMRILASRLYEAEQEKISSEYTAQRRSQIGSGMRNERIRTYNFPQNRVTDHRLTGENKNFNISAVMNGDLDPIIDALTMQEQAEKLRESTES